MAVLLNDMNSSGGIQRVAVNLVRELGERYDTRLLSVEPLRKPVFYDPDLHLASLGFARRGGANRLRYVAELSLVALKLRHYVIEQRIDIVLAIWYDFACIAALALPRSVVKIGCEHIAYEEAPRFWRNMRRLSYPRLDAVVGLTEADLPKLSQLSRNALVIPNAVPMPAPAASDPREKILLCVGHLISRKGLDRLLWALQKPLHDHPDWQLAFVGGGEKGHTDWGYLDYLATLLKLLRLEGRVVLYPATKYIEEWYRRASVYVMGSRQEGLPLVLIEAKSFGLPIVSFDCPTGPREIVHHNVDGFLIQDDDQAFGEAVSALMTDKPLWNRMSMAALEDVKARFSVEAISQRWFELIDPLYAKRQMPSAAGA
ncbi:MAG: glycosyltransferase family 4 protein [Chloroflexi bacterium]|nr:glycosyltransferase family 4 protein [Chloroflexota bacterium]